MSVLETVREIVTRIVRRPATEFAKETTFKDMV